MSIVNGNNNSLINEIKILVIGALGTGKTSFVEKWAKNEFNESYFPTTIPECRCNLYEKDKKIYKINIWDLPGKNNKSFLKFHSKDTHGCIVIFDSTRPKKTLKSSLKQKYILDEINKFIDGKGLPSILIESKSDNIKDIINKVNGCRLKNIIQRNGFIDGFIASSKINYNINESIKLLLDEIILRMKIYSKNNIYNLLLQNDKLEKVEEKFEESESEEESEENELNILKFEENINNEDAIGNPEGNEGIDIKFEDYYSNELNDEILSISMKKNGLKKMHKYSGEIAFQELQKKYKFLSAYELDYYFIDNLEVLNRMNKVKVKLYLKNIMIRICILICDLAGDEKEITFDLIHEGIKKEEKKDFLIKELIKKRKKKTKRKR